MSFADAVRAACHQPRLTSPGNPPPERDPSDIRSQSAAVRLCAAADDSGSAAGARGSIGTTFLSSTPWGSRNAMSEGRATPTHSRHAQPVHSLAHTLEGDVHRLSRGSSTGLFVHVTRGFIWLPLGRCAGRRGVPSVVSKRSISRADYCTVVRTGGGLVSITDDVRGPGPSGPPGPPPGGPPGGGPPPPRDGQYDKTPPQDVAAEQCVLGGMLLSKDAIADVVEILQVRRLLPPGPRDDLRRDPRPLRPGRARRPDHRLRRPRPTPATWPASVARPTCTR